MTNRLIAQQAAISVGVLTVVGTILGAYLYKRNKKKRTPTEWKEVGTVTVLRLYPLKSGKCIDVRTAECTVKGLIELEKPDKSFRFRDRAFVVYHEESLEYRTARHFSQLFLVEMTAVDHNGFDLNAPGMKTLFVRVPNEKDSKKFITKHYRNEEIACLDCGDEAAEWISKYVLGTDSGLRLSYNDGSTDRDIVTVFKDVVEWTGHTIDNESSGILSDLSALHLVNQASVDDVNLRLPTEHKITADNFRPNLVVSDPELKPYVEDEWTYIKIGDDVIIKNVFESVRCMMTTVDPDSATRRSDKEPYKTMDTYRRSKSPMKGPVMGCLLKVLKIGKISVGDKVYVGK